MPAKVFSDLLARAQSAGVSNQTVQARDWFRDKAGELKRVSSSAVISQSQDRWKTRVMPGRMYFMQYDPKTKADLPYYDRFPLIFPLSIDKNSFLGINFHYLSYNYRARLMDALYDIRSNTKMDETTKLNLSYQILAGASKYKYFAPTVKRYLTAHVRSKFVEVYANEWDIALFLPVEQFSKATKQVVWEDSRKMIAKK